MNERTINEAKAEKGAEDDDIKREKKNNLREKEKRDKRRS